MRTIPVTTVPTPAAGCNCAVCPFYMNNPEAVEPICSGSNSDCDYCGCARQRDCGECSIRCGSRVDIAEWMVDVGGTLSFDDIELTDLELPEELPRFTPQVDTATISDLDAGLDWPAYAIGLRRVFSPRTYRMLPSFTGRTAREALGLPPGRLTVLVGYGEDPLVEGFWTHRHQMYEELAAQQWDLVLAPNYSAYANMPRTEMLLNFRRNLLIAEEMGEWGINAVPNLYSYRLEDLDRVAAWLEVCRPPAVAVNLQTQRDDNYWHDLVLAGLTHLSLSLPSETRIICTGTSRLERFEILTELFGDRLFIVSQNAIQYARHGAVMGPNGRQDLHATVGDAFAATVRYYAATLDELQHPNTKG